MVKRVPLILFLLAAVLIVHNQGQAGDAAATISLYRVAGAPPWPETVLASPSAVIRQELQSCLIVAAPAATAAQWEKEGVAFSLLDDETAGKDYFLVFLHGASADPNLSDSLHLVRLEESLYLYAGPLPLLDSALPQPYSLKKLPERIRLPEKREGKALPKEEAAVARLSRASGEIASMVQAVSRSGIAARIQTLQNFQTRRAETSGCQAAGDYLFGYLSSLGLATTAEAFPFFTNNSSRNIVAALDGKSNPEKRVILCAHYDSTSNQPFTLAPGADDNASGTAAVLEAARIMSRYRFDYTLCFILFSAEEQGLYGSADYAKKAAGRGDKIIAVLNLDMIAYADLLPEDLDIVANPASEWLADEFRKSAELYAPVPTKKTVNSSFKWSDHSSFWDQGYSALCGIEDSNIPLPNPYYHKTSDTFDKLNLEFAEAVTRAALATAADLAQPIPLPRPPSGLTARSHIHASLFSSSKSVALAWQPSPDPVKGYNVYRSSSTDSSWQKLNTAPLAALTFSDRFLSPAVTYYYAVTAVDDQERESNFSSVVKENADNPE